MSPKFPGYDAGEARGQGAMGDKCFILVSDWNTQGQAFLSP